MSRDWENKAACRHYRADGWYPPGRGHQRGAAVAEAVRICITECPVRAACADFADRTRQKAGVWGGVDLGDTATRQVSETARDALRRVAEGVGS